MYTLSSGLTSNIYVDLRGALCLPWVRRELSSIIPRGKELSVGGPGPISLVTTLSDLWGIPSFYLRGKGCLHGEPASPCLLLDDVLTTGGSLEGVLNLLQVEVGRILVLVDRSVPSGKAMPSCKYLFKLEGETLIPNPEFNIPGSIVDVFQGCVKK